MNEEILGPLLLYVDHEKKEVALSFGFVDHLFAPIEVYTGCSKEVRQIKKDYEAKGHKVTSPYYMKNSTEPKDGEASILIKRSYLPCE